MEQLSPLLACAVLKAEDRSFFRHHGVEWGNLWSATRGWLQGRTRHGASTLTQQLARNLYFSPERTVHRKLRELLMARELEATLHKRRILELYLNTVEWGDGVWGASSASEHYFGKAPASLDAFEASFLAGLLAAPRRALVGDNAKRARAVQSRVLGQFRASGLLEPRDYMRALMRMDMLHASLERGQPLPEALLAARAPTEESRVPSPEPVLMDTVLWEECGWERERVTAALYSEMLHHGR
ncbi:MAG TPA: biosynthetic peptidoglycan transglycosylase [Myxococcaceae bacterium]